MRKTIFTCALVLGVSAACGIVGVGCSGDDTQQDAPDSATGTDAAKDTSTPKDATGGDTSKPDTGGNGDDAGQDTGTPDTSTPDTGTDSGTDAGHDSGTDSGTDAGHDSGTDSGTDAGHDSGTDSGADTGTDSGPVDSGTDATDSGTDSGLDAGTDASDASTIGFNNPVQVDVTTVLNANTVVTTTPLGGAILTSMDKTGWDFFTQSKASQLGVAYIGLPDDASFAANGTIHPAVKLHWNNSAITMNSRVVQDATPFVFPVTPNQYSNIQLYGVSTEGSTSISVVLTYSDTTQSTPTVLQIADWFNAPTSDQFTLVAGMNRIQNGLTVDTRNIPGIFGSNVAPDPSKSVTAVSVTNTGTGYFVFYGAVAY